MMTAARAIDYTPAIGHVIIIGIIGPARVQ